jgi:hypothetical protein
VFLARAGVWWVGGGELLLSAGLAYDVGRNPLLVAVAYLFTVFVAYHVAVALRTRSLMCSCSGAKAAVSPASFTAIAGTCVGNMVPAAVALWLALSSATTGEIVVILSEVSGVSRFSPGCLRDCDARIRSWWTQSEEAQVYAKPQHCVAS